MKGISLEEKMAICYAIIEDIRDWPMVYKFAHAIPEDQEIPASRVYDWKRLTRITNYIAMVRARTGIYEGADPAKINIAPKENGPIDFTDREQFINYLNGQINTLGDDSTKTKYLQMLSDLLRYKESRPEGENEIQRFYTPLTCRDCVLYKEAQTQLDDNQNGNIK